MSDQIFENPRLVEIYDHFDGERQDLDHYISIVKELKAKTVLDVGSGTGCLACRLAGEGYEVIGLEPAKASIDIARRKYYADQVRWLQGDTTNLPEIKIDLAIMTGNVAQVFLTDDSWSANLLAIRRALSPSGHLVFEVRDPAKKAWLDWTRDKTYQRLNVPSIGYVEGWCEVLDVAEDLVSFRWTYVFESDGQKIISDSKLRFRSREAIEYSLEKSGYLIKEIRDAPDRPGKEFVFIAARAHAF